MVPMQCVHGAKPFVATKWHISQWNVVSIGVQVPLGLTKVYEIQLVFLVFLPEHYVVWLYVAMNVAEIM